MSHHSGNYGGQYRSPLTTRDKVWLWVIAIGILALVFGPVIGAFKWWVFG